VAVEEFGLSLLQMMENAGRNLAGHVCDVGSQPVVVLAGNGGNGGGGLCAARHLANRDLDVSVVLDRPPENLDGAAHSQYETLAAMGVPVDEGVTDSPRETRRRSSTRSSATGSTGRSVGAPADSSRPWRRWTRRSSRSTFPRG